MRHVCLISPSLGGGGAEREAVVTANNLAERGYPVTLISFFKVQSEFNIEDNVQVIYLSEVDDFKVLWLFKYVKMLKSILTDLGPDILISYIPKITYLVAKANKKKHIPHYDRVINAIKFGHPLTRFFQFLALPKVSGIILQCDEQKSLYTPKYQKRSLVIGNPLSADVWGTKKTEYRAVRQFLAIGRLGSQKNYPLMLRAFAAAHKTNPEISLTIFGRGPEEKRIKRLIHKAGLEKSVHLNGYHPNMINEIAKYDAYLLTSRYEGLPNALMESMGVGLPVISLNTRTGPTDLINDHQNGILVKTHTPEAIAMAISELVNNKELSQKLGKQARVDILETYDIKKTIDKYIQLIEELPHAK